LGIAASIGPFPSLAKKFHSFDDHLNPKRKAKQTSQNYVNEEGHAEARPQYALFSALLRPETDRFINSNPLPIAHRKGGRKRYQWHIGQHTAHGCYVHSKQVHWLVYQDMFSWNWPCLTARRASVVLSVQNWLGESAEAKKSSSQPAYFSKRCANYPLSYGPCSGTLRS
jgi:hypothetical protein